MYNEELQDLYPYRSVKRVIKEGDGLSMWHATGRGELQTGFSGET
jgi:hypothetical protein